ncbi:hypothetical protein [Sedimenticola selenatireducens]|uniref:Uncharacterized protein n=1 Tax=Sedimenticola selenatireducens TaxID=191960 RepID=A0A558E1M9_9GAMM|nr:hypothetical protein [Sedimenticola selenatireducens]TVO75147.1 hypothetical protein FHP88_09035 [Sedimenticola selenatireducens]TVT66998.1 MAG: hypothetical protein FHK78_01320 [Sedimenticola selenatireducens]
MTVGLDAGQANKEVTVNQMVMGYLAKSVAGGVDVTLTDNECTYQQIELTGAITANIVVNMTDSANVTHFYNNTSGAFTVTVQPTSGTGVTITQGTRCQIGCDGAGNAYKLTAEL